MEEKLTDGSLRAISIVDADAALIGGGGLEWVPVRRELGVRAFGINAFRAADTGEPVIEQHVESPGQQELYLVLRGAARFSVGEESLDAPTGTAVFVEDPELSREAVALESGTVVVAIGGWADRAYAPLPWEPIYLAQEAMREGRWAEAAETLEREAGEHSGSAFVQYRLAFCRARAGEDGLALTALARAIEANPAMRERAEGEAAFDSLRRLDAWPPA